ncbi:MAG: alpha/beta hydrolase [Acidimicrobiia bacterium]|nr:alpha/beta hydrolase [Acidimicrobiia bacterium]
MFLVSSLGLLILILVAAMWMFQRRLIYLPGGAVPPVDEILVGWSEASLVTTDGLELGAWYSAPDTGKPVVIVFNGNAGSRVDRAELGSQLEAQGFGVLLVDYRGYGGNPGSPSEAGLALDARAANQWVREEASGHPVEIFGESLGTAVAIEVAVAHPPAALILRSPFTSLADVARQHYRLTPPPILLQDRYPSNERIQSVAAPILVIAGSEDSIVPLSQSRALYELAPTPKELVIVRGADHNDPELVAGPEVIEAIDRFVDQATGGQR